MKHLLLTLVGSMALTTPAVSFSSSLGDRTNELVKGLHFEIAKALVESRVRHETCETDAYQSAIIEELEKSGSAAKIKALTARTPSFASELGANFAFRRLLADINPRTKISSAEFEKVAVGSTFWSNQGGVYGNSRKLSFEKGGKVTLGHLNISTQNPVYDLEKGTYKVIATDDASPLQIEVTVGGVATYFEVQPGASEVGQVRLVPVGQPISNGYGSEPSECDV